MIYALSASQPINKFLLNSAMIMDQPGSNVLTSLLAFLSLPLTHYMVDCMLTQNNNLSYSRILTCCMAAEPSIDILRSLTVAPS